MENEKTVEENFYQPTVVNPETGETKENYVASAEDAQELAVLQATKGMDAAVAREKELSEGITETDKKNIEVMEGLAEKYPHAFTPETDKEGKPYLICKSTMDLSRGVYDNAVVIVSQRGMTYFTTGDSNLTENIKAGKYDITFKGSERNDLTPLAIETGESNGDSGILSNYIGKTYDFESLPHPDDAKNLKERFSRAEELHANDVVEEEKTAADLLAEL